MSVLSAEDLDDVYAASLGRVYEVSYEDDQRRVTLSLLQDSDDSLVLLEQEWRVVAGKSEARLVGRGLTPAGAVAAAESREQALAATMKLRSQMGLLDAERVADAVHLHRLQHTPGALPVEELPSL